MIEVCEPTRRIAGNASPTIARRKNLPIVGTPPPVSRRFLQELRRFDPGVEVIWNGFQNHWSLYRVTRHHATRSLDVLLKEFDLCGPRGEYRPLGGWVLDEMRARSLLLEDPRPEKSGEALNKITTRADEELQKKEQNEIIDLTDDMHTHLEWAKRGRASQMADPDYIPKDRPKTGMKRIVGKESPKRNTVT